MQTTPALDAAVRRGQQIHLVRVEVLEPDLALPPDQWPVVATLTGDQGIVLGGGVTMDGRRLTQRSLDGLSLANDLAGTWTPKAGGLIDTNTTLRVWKGLRTAAGDVFAPMITALADQPSSDTTPGTRTVSISGQDRSRLLQFGVSQPVTYGADWRVQDAIRDIAQTAGLGTADDLYVLDDDSHALGLARTFATGTLRWDAMQQIAQDFALILSFDPYGRLTLRPASDPNAAARVWTFEPAEDGTLLRITKTRSDRSLFNHTLVTGENARQRPLRGEAQVTDPESPIYPGRPNIGDRLLPPVTLPGVATQDQATTKALQLLFENALEEESIALEVVSHPGLEPGDVVGVFEQTSAVDGDYILDRVQSALGSARMTLATRRVRNLLA